MKEVKKILSLFLMTFKGYSVLKHLIANEQQHIISLVVIGKDKKVESDYSSEIESLCKQHLINFTYKYDEGSIHTKYSIAISWRKLIEIRHSKLIVLHDSLLPKYRGFSPLVNQLINQERQIGVTAIFSSDKYDRGPIICSSAIDIEYPILIQNAIEKIAVQYCLLISQLISQIADDKNELSAIEQDDNEATYSLWRDEEDYRINWNWSASKIVRFINAVGFPYHGAYSIMDNKKVRIVSAEEYSDVYIENRDVGKVIFIENNSPVIVCGEGLLKLNQVIRDEDKKSILPLNKFRSRFL